MGTVKLSGKPDEMLGGNLVMGESSNTPSRFLLHGNWYKL